MQSDTHLTFFSHVKLGSTEIPVDWQAGAASITPIAFVPGGELKEGEGTGVTFIAVDITSERFMRRSQSFFGTPKSRSVKYHLPEAFTEFGVDFTAANQVGKWKVPDGVFAGDESNLVRILQTLCDKSKDKFYAYWVQVHDAPAVGQVKIPNLSSMIENLESPLIELDDPETKRDLTFEATSTSEIVVEPGLISNQRSSISSLSCN